jgi:hypothetical protein
MFISTALVMKQKPNKKHRSTGKLLLDAIVYQLKPGASKGKSWTRKKSDGSISKECFQARTPEGCQHTQVAIPIERAAGLSHTSGNRRTAEAFAKAGLAEFDVDPPFQARMANGSIESCSDAVILRTTRMEDGKTYHIRCSVLEELPDRIIIGRSAFAQIGRYDLLAVAEKSNAPEEGKAREKASRARFEKLREARQRYLADSLDRVCKNIS